MIHDRRRDSDQPWLELIDRHRVSLMPHSGELTIQLGTRSNRTRRELREAAWRMCGRAQREKNFPGRLRVRWPAAADLGGRAEKESSLYFVDDEYLSVG